MTVARLFLVLLAGAASLASGTDGGHTISKKAAKTLALTQRYPSNVIQLTEENVEHVLVGKSRPYHVVILADANYMRNHGKIQLGKVLREYDLASTAYAAHLKGTPAEGSVVFAVMEYVRDRNLFGRLGVTSLPYMSIVPPSQPVTADHPLSLSPSQIKTDAGYPWMAETVVSWVAEVTGLPAPQIERQPLVSPRLVPLLTLLVVACLGYAGFRLAQQPLLQRREVYALGALFVFWFSFSGGMHNIIRGMPLMYHSKRRGGLQLFMRSTGQLGAEGYSMGTMYMLAALSTAGLVHALPKVQSAAARRRLGFLLLSVAVFAMRVLMTTHSWKTNTRPQWYLFL